MMSEGIRSGTNNVQKARHDHCIACGARNPRGLALEFQPDERGGVAAEFSCDRAFTGYEGRVHGGVISTVLDAAMTHCTFAMGAPGFTVELKVRFLRPVETGRPAGVRAWLDKSSHWMNVLCSELVQDGEVRATAVGKFVDAPYSIEKRSGAAP